MKTLNDLEIKMFKTMKKNTNMLLDERQKLKEEIKVMKREVNILKKQNQRLLNKYNALSNSKLGKLTLKYWDIKRKLK